jgi:hypothetical protein
VFAPSACTCFSLPTLARRTGGILIVAMTSDYDAWRIR